MEETLRIYTAAAYGRKHEIREYATQAEKCGIKVGAEWLKEPDSPDSDLSDSIPEKLATYAQQDWWDVGACDIFVFWAENPHKQPPRGGRLTELGFAISLGKKIVVIGEPENIFFYLPGIDIEFFHTWESALVYLTQLKIGE
jgi:nucleoside 2-deoxyribosyltransferase